MKRAVQQTLIRYTKPTLLKGGIIYNFSHPELSDSEELKANSNKGVSNQNHGSNPMAPGGCEDKPRGIAKCSRDESSAKKRREDQPPPARR